MIEGTHNAVVDRIVDGQTAVVLIEVDGEVSEQIDIEADELPKDVGEGDVIEITISSGTVESVHALREETQSRKEKAQDRFDQLSEKLSDKNEDVETDPNQE